MAADSSFRISARAHIAGSLTGKRYTKGLRHASCAPIGASLAATGLPIRAQRC